MKTTLPRVTGREWRAHSQGDWEGRVVSFSSIRISNRRSKYQTNVCKAERRTPQTQLCIPAIWDLQQQDATKLWVPIMKVSCLVHGLEYSCTEPFPSEKLSNFRSSGVELVLATLEAEASSRPS